MNRRRVEIFATMVILLGACSADEPRRALPTITSPTTATPGPTTPATSPPPVVPDPRTVSPQSLLRAGATPDAVLYGELNGVVPEEIVMLSSMPSENTDFPPQPYLDAFAWDPGREAWVSVFDARDFKDGGGRGPVLGAEGEGVAQDVPFLQLIDFADDGAMEVVVGAQTFGASTGPLELWIFSWLSEAFATEFFRRTERGGQVAFSDASISLETGVYGPADPGCCPSQFETLQIGWDAARERIVVLERTVEEAPQG